MVVAAAFDDLLDRSNLTGRQFLIYAGQRLHPGVVLYNSVYAIRWPKLDPERFKAVWQSLVDTCDALRIVVDEVDGVPQQRVLSPFQVEVDCLDVRQHEQREQAAREWIEARLQRPLVLTERIFDTALIRTGDEEYVWFLHIHHIVVDGAAVQILIRRVTELYWEKDEGSGQWPKFADHAAAACSMRQTDQYRDARAYWLDKLKQVPETPHFYGVDAFRNTAQERVVLTLARPTGAAIAALARSLASPTVSEHAVAANLFNAILAAYLGRVSGSEQVSIGVTFHNRSSEQDRRTIGLHMEVFPISLRVQPEDSLTSLMRQVATCTAQALQHRQYSVGHSARAPAFSGLFNYMRALTKPLGNLDMRRVHPGHGSNAISLSIEPRDETYDLWFDVNADVAATSSAQRLAEHLRTLLEAAVREPERPLSQLPLLPSDEAGDMLLACTGPSLQLRAAEAGCHRLFEVRAAATPGAPAVAFGTTALSYAQLNRRANRLACQMRALGARQGKRVAICLDRSPEMVVAVLGALKSGAAYVPLDPAYPLARLRTMLGDSDPVVLITTERIAASLPPNAARSLYIDADSEASQRDHAEGDNFNARIDPEDIAM